MEQSKSIDLSVIIVSYNVEHFLHLCLESVYAAINNFNAEVIVIDNASADNSVEMIRKKEIFCFRLKKVRNQFRIGLCF